MSSQQELAKCPPKWLTTVIGWQNHSHQLPLQAKCVLVIMIMLVIFCSWDIIQLGAFGWGFVSSTWAGFASSSSPICCYLFVTTEVLLVRIHPNNASRYGLSAAFLETRLYPSSFHSSFWFGQMLYWVFSCSCFYDTNKPCSHLHQLNCCSNWSEAGISNWQSVDMNRGH